MQTEMNTWGPFRCVTSGDEEEHTDRVEKVLLGKKKYYCEDNGL